MSIYSDKYNLIDTRYSNLSWEFEQVCKAKEYLCDLLELAETDEERERIEKKIDEFADRLEELASCLVRLK